MAEGTVKWFNNAKGWGFIRIEDGPDIFVHYSQIEGDGFRTLREGEVVEFELRDGPRGQFAEHVNRSDPPPPMMEAEVEASSMLEAVAQT